MGVDEAGRGALAGPVVAAAVVLRENSQLAKEGLLVDSKKLSPKRRELLYPLICQEALAYGVGMATVQEIDEFNILRATLLAMQRAVKEITLPISEVRVDGRDCPDLPVVTRAIVRGDSTDNSIAAASILAKVERDNIMLQYDVAYPEYGFAQHKGYGTKAHYSALASYGMIAIHRTSFRLF